MSKITLTDIANLQNPTTAVNAINSNSAVIQTAFDNTLSRDGTSPNQMGSNLDMNGNTVINMGAPGTAASAVRLEDLTAAINLQNTNTTVNIVSPYQSIFSYLPANQIPLIQAHISTYDCGPAFNTALAALNGETLYVPPGTYPIYTQIKYAGVASPYISTSIVPGLKMLGAGCDVTQFRNYVPGLSLANAFSTTTGSSSVTVVIPNHGFLPQQPICFSNMQSNIGGLLLEGNWRIASVIDANTIQFYHYKAATSTVTNFGNGQVVVPMINCTNYNTLGQSVTAFQIGTEFRGIMFAGTAQVNGSCHLRMTGQFQALLDDVWFLGGDTGIQIFATTGDVPINNVVDSSSGIIFKRVRFDNCGRWGAEITGQSENIGGTIYGHNEVSNVIFENTLWSQCGYNQSVDLTQGGGLKWKGQGIHFTSSAFTTSNNCSIYIAMPAGASGQPSAFTFDFLVFENTRGNSAMYVDACDTITGQLLEIYSGPGGNPPVYGVYFNYNSSSAIDNVNIQSCIVRADPTVTPYTLFQWNGTVPNSVRIYTPSLQEWGAAGQSLGNITFKT